MNNDDNHDNVTLTYCFQGPTPVYVIASIVSGSPSVSLSEVPVGVPAFETFAVFVTDSPSCILRTGPATRVERS